MNILQNWFIISDKDIFNFKGTTPIYKQDICKYYTRFSNVLNSCYASLYADDTVIYCYLGTSSKELSDKLNNDLVGVAKWLDYHKLTLIWTKLNACLSVVIGNAKAK